MLRRELDRAARQVQRLIRRGKYGSAAAGAQEIAEQAGRLAWATWPSGATAPWASAGVTTAPEPAQLALALLLDATGDSDVALEHYQAFKTAFVARWPSPGGWVLSVGEMAGWVEERMGL